MLVLMGEIVHRLAQEFEMLHFLLRRPLTGPTEYGPWLFSDVLVPFAGFEFEFLVMC